MAPLATDRKDQFEGVNININQGFFTQLEQSSSTQNMNSTKEVVEELSQSSSHTNDVSDFEFKKERQKILDLAVNRLPSIIQVISSANANLGNTTGSDFNDLRSLWKRGTALGKSEHRKQSN